MRNAIKEYIEYNEKEKRLLWDTATFVFDTNIFLNLYRYSSRSRDSLLDSFERLKERIWMPYQVAYEFCEKRYSIIEEVNKRFDDIEKDIDNIEAKWKNNLRINKNDSDFNKLFKDLKDGIIKKKNSDYITFKLSDDLVFDKLLYLFDGKTGKELCVADKNSIQKEGKERFENNLPPGYKDNNKQQNKYGDLFIWKEILSYSKENKVDIIFVTDDTKEDWWNIINGKTIGPRIELRKEFIKETGKQFHMYTMSSFLAIYSENNGNNIDKNTMDEVESVSAESRKRIYDKTNKQVYNYSIPPEGLVIGASTLGSENYNIPIINGSRMDNSLYNTTGYFDNVGNMISPTASKLFENAGEQLSTYTQAAQQNLRFQDALSNMSYSIQDPLYKMTRDSNYYENNIITRDDSEKKTEH